jgi:phosphate transport system protein
MKRMVLDQELQALEAQVLQLGTLVENALAGALETFESGNQDQAGAVVMGDTTIDDLHLAIEEHALRILTLQQPLGGRDLRFLSSVAPIAIDLERIGDEAEGIAQDVLRMIPYRQSGTPRAKGEPDLRASEDGEAAIMQSMLDLGNEVRTMLAQTMQAFANRDAQAARSIWEEDKRIDQRHYIIQRDLLTMLEESHALPALQHDPHRLQRTVYLLWIAHRLERAADHCTNICERIVFIVAGETDIASSLWPGN